MTQKEVREIADTEQIVKGTEEVKKMLKKDELDKVFTANNTPEKVLKDLKRYCNMNGTELEELDMTNEEVGVLCREPYPITVLARKK